MSTKTEITISNYRLIKDLTMVFETGNLYFINAKNNSGKTSIIELIQDMFEAKASTDNTVSFGEEIGETKIKIINFKDEEGANFVLKYEYGATNKFTLIMPDGSIKKKVTDIRDVFKYQRMTVDKFFQLGLSPEGRREQGKFIKNLIPKEVNIRIDDIEKDINERNGILFKERGLISSSLKAMQNILTDLQLTDDEKNALKIKDVYIEKTKVIKKEYDELKEQKLLSNSDNLKKQQLTTETIIREAETTIIDNNAKIERLRGEIKLLELENENKLISINKNKESLKSIEKSLKDDMFTEEDELKLTTLSDSINKRVENEKKLDALSIKYTNLLNQQKSVEEKIKLLDKKNELLETLRAEKKTLISKAKLPENLSIIDDELLYNENGNYIPFNENNVSYATGGKEIIKLIAQVNHDLPIIVIGKAAEYDPKSLDELAQLAKEQNKILVCDYVSTNEDIEITCYQKGEMNNV